MPKTKKIKHSVASTEIVKVIPQKIYRSIDELFGHDRAVYKTHNEIEYRTYLQPMNVIELQEEGFKVGVGSTANRAVMIERLMKKFRQVTNSILGTDKKPVRLKMTPELKELLSEGANKQR